MRVLYLTMNPNRESTTVPTEGWFRTLRPRGLEPVLISSVSGAFQKWADGEGVPCYETRLPFPNKMRPWAFLSALASVIRIARRHRVDLIHSNEQDVYPIGQYCGEMSRSASRRQRAFHDGWRLCALGVRGSKATGAHVLRQRRQPGGLSAGS